MLKQQTKVRVLQLIDSLRPGGAEKMAVTYANAMLGQMDGSYLCCSRMEGLLKESLHPHVEYLFLNKKNSLDLKAIFKLRNFIKSRNISIVHAHSTSFFLAGLLKLTGLKFKLVWHDHYGESELLKERNYEVLKIFSFLFSGIISVNANLKKWAQEHLECSNVIEINNFTPKRTSGISSGIKLKGKEYEFKIICVANLRPQKDHDNLINAFESLSVDLPLSLHLIGENPETQYSNSILKSIKDSPLKENIYYYGAQTEILTLLPQANLGILSSRSEGLPVALLEYGMAGLPVICTNVGKCSEVLGKNGVIVESNDPKALAEGILFYLKNRTKMKLDAENFRGNLVKNYSQEAVVKKITRFYNSL
jgi:glycosyltransferase involved in cell wall biosynthesis